LQQPRYLIVVLWIKYIPRTEGKTENGVGFELGMMTSAYLEDACVPELEEGWEQLGLHKVAAAAA
jgi:hypothetical protein